MDSTAGRAWTEPVITSGKNPRIRAAASLRTRSERDATGLTLVDGARELQRACTGGATVVEIFVDPPRLGAEGEGAVEGARRHGAAVIPVSGPVLDRLAFGGRNDGVVAVVRIPSLHLGSLRLPADPLVVVLEAVEKPGNLGAVMRSADGAGADAVIVADPRTDPFNPNAIRASLGTVFAVPLAAGPSAEVRTCLAEAGLRLVIARVGEGEAYTHADLRGPVALVLGSEAEGLSDAWGGDGTTAVQLPMRGVADSLNVSIAAAVLLYEARRQRDLP